MLVRLQSWVVLRRRCHCLGWMRFASCVALFGACDDADDGHGDDAASDQLSLAHGETSCSSEWVCSGRGSGKRAGVCLPDPVRRREITGAGSAAVLYWRRWGTSAGRVPGGPRLEGAGGGVDGRVLLLVPRRGHAACGCDFRAGGRRLKSGPRRVLRERRGPGGVAGSVECADLGR